MLANGCFDPAHVGHVLHLEAARKHGTELVVALTSDATVKKEKGQNRPLFAARLRARMLRALRCVDRVVIVDSLMEGLRKVRPAVLVKGSDYMNGLSAEHAAYCARKGIAVRITDTPKWSATKIGNALRSR